LGISTARGDRRARPPETGELKRVPGSARTYTQSQIDSFNDPPDWFPDEHPPPPTIVAHGKGPKVRACVSCHLSTGSKATRHANPAIPETLRGLNEAAVAVDEISILSIEYIM
jgi:hypothetical protein